MTAGASFQEPSKTGERLGAVFFTLVGLALLWWLMGLPGWPGGFTEGDLDNAKRSIKAEFEKSDGITVTTVELVRKSANEAIGFAKLKVGPVEISKSCTATRGDGRVIWSCN